MKVAGYKKKRRIIGKGEALFEFDFLRRLPKSVDVTI